MASSSIPPPPVSLTYRMAGESDYPALIEIWNEHRDWGEMKEEFWSFLMHPPFGDTRVAVAIDADSGSIAGLLLFIPSRVQLDGHEVRALRPGAMLLRPHLRGIRSADMSKLPFIAMFNHGLAALQSSDVSVVYMVPDPRWARLFKMFPNYTSASFPLWSLPLPLEHEFSLTSGYTAHVGHADDQRVPKLWAASSRLHGCSVVRNEESLMWRVGNGAYTLTAVERGRELVGLVASIAKGDRQWLMCDLLVADAGEALRNTLAAACNVAHRQAQTADGEKPLIKVAVLVTSVLEPAVRTLGFTRDAYDFTLFVNLLDPSVSSDRAAPSRWYLSAND